MNNPRNLLIGLLFLVALVAGTPLVFPYDIFKGKLETRLSQITQSKATIGKITFSYAPQPVFTLNNVVLDQPEVARLDSIILPLNIANLRRWGEELRDVTISGAQVSRKFAIELPNRLHPTAGNSMRIDHITLQNASVKLDGSTLGPIDGMLRFRADGNIESLSILADQGRAELQLSPGDEAGSFKVQFDAKGWTSPLGYPVVFDYVKLIGTANATGIDIADIRADLYGGIATGSAKLSWQDNWDLTGQLFAKNIDAESLVRIFSPTTYPTGRLNADGNFRYKADNYNHLFKEPQLQGRFAIQDGTLHNFDLITPMKSQSPSVLNRGGQTNYNTLSGNLAANSKIVQLSNLALDSGKFSSRGALTIMQGGKISGDASSRLAAGAVVASNHLTIGGQLSSPELRSGGSSRPEIESHASEPAAAQ